MATATTEDELLIITDDETSEELNIEIKQEGEPKNDIITFGEVEISEDLQIDLSNDEKDVTVEDIFSEKKEENIGDNGLDLNFDFDLGDSEKKEEKIDLEIKDEVNIIEEDKEQDKKEESENNVDFSFDLGEEKEEVEKIEEDNILEIKNLKDEMKNEILKTEEIEINNKLNPEIEITNLTEDFGSSSSTGGDDGTTGDDDINSILEATIKKLKIRKESIAEVKKETSNKIDDLAKEIKSLQAEVKANKSEITKFNKETTKIDENVESLEKMKMK